MKKENNQNYVQYCDLQIKIPIEKEEEKQTLKEALEDHPIAG